MTSITVFTEDEVKHEPGRIGGEGGAVSFMGTFSLTHASTLSGGKFLNGGAIRKDL